MNHATELQTAMEERRSLYSLVSLLFAAPLTQEQIDRLGDAGLSEREDVSHGLAVMGKCLRKHDADTRQALAVDYTGTFYGMRTTGGRAALPYESAHDAEGGEQMFMGKARARVYNVFKKHALRLGQSLNLPEDHLSFECDFMAVLAERTKERLAEGDDAEALRLLTTQRSFLARHIASWYPRFAQLALSLSKERFYHGALEFAQDFFALDADLLDNAIAAVEDETGLRAEDVALDMEWLETPPRDDEADRAGDEAWKVASC